MEQKQYEFIVKWLDAADEFCEALTEEQVKEFHKCTLPLVHEIVRLATTADPENDKEVEEWQS